MKNMQIVKDYFLSQSKPLTLIMYRKKNTSKDEERNNYDFSI